MILALHLLIILTTTWVLVPLDTFSNPLWVAATNAAMFKGSSPHKCSQKVWWDALNVVTATIPSVMSGLTPSPKLFLYNMISSGNVPRLLEGVTSLAR